MKQHHKQNKIPDRKRSLKATFPSGMTCGKAFTIFGVFFAFVAIIVAFWGFFGTSPEQNWEPAKAKQASSSDGGALDPVSLIDQMNGVQCLDDSTKTEIIDILEGTGVTPTDITCQEVLDSCFQKQQEQFPALTDHFLSSAASSQLYEPALDLLIQWDKESETVVNAISIVWPQGRTVSENPIPQCRAMQAELYDGLKSALKNLAIESANAKKTYKLVSKYKEINAHLSELTDQMGRFHGYMDRIAQRVPALSKYCQ